MIKPVRQADLLEAITRVLNPPASGQTQPTLVTRHSLRESRRRLHILLPEGNPIKRKLAVHMLENPGHGVWGAENGLQVLSLLKKASFDLIHMDVQMPEMDGLQTTRMIREHGKTEGEHIPIVAMTAHALKGDREKCLQAGMDGSMSKPFNFQELTEPLKMPLR